MLTATLSALPWFGNDPARSDTASVSPERLRSPVFIGDAVQPFGQETLLLFLMRKAAQEEPDQSGE